MKYNLVRTGTFETNSSSSHTISICQKSDFMVPDFQEEWFIDGGNYSDRYLTLDTFQEKLNHLGQVIWDIAESQPEVNQNNCVQVLEDLIKEQTGCSKVTWCKENLQEGYTDWELRDREILNYKDMKNLLFRTGSKILTGRAG